MTAKLFSSLVAAVAFVGVASTTVASAAPANNTKESRIDRLCSQESRDDASEREQRRIDRAAERFKLTDAQKAAFKDLQDTRLKARNDYKTAVCANKPDLSTLEGRLAFRQAVLEQRLAQLKATTPKMLAFYNSLDADQKAQFDESRQKRKHRRR